MRSRRRRESHRDITLNVLHYHNGVIHHDPYRQHQPEQTEGVKRETQQVKHAERSHHRNRHGQQRNDRCTPGLQEQDYHQHHQHNRFKQRLHHGTDRVTHEHGWIVRCRPLHIVREAGGQFGHLVTHGVRQVDGVGPRCLEDTDADRVLVVQLRAQGVATGTHLNARHVTQAHQRAVIGSFQDDIAELFFALQTPLGVDRQQEVAGLFGRLCAQLTGRHLHVLLLHSADHIRSGHATCGHLIRIEPDAHRILARPEDLNLTNAWQARQLIFHLQGGVVTQIE